MCATSKLASMQKLNITTDTLISVYDVTHLKIKESSSGLSKKFSPPSRGRRRTLRRGIRRLPFTQNARQRTVAL